MKNNTDTAALSLLANEAGFDPIEDRLRENVRATIEAVIEEELDAFLGRCRYDRGAGKPTGYRHGHRERQLIGTFGAETISVPRARTVDEAGKTTEWHSKALPRYQRLTKKAEALIASVYLAGTNTRRVKRALFGLFEGAVSKDVVSRAWRKVKVDTTVQTKAVAHPTDSHLLLRVAAWLVRLAKRYGVKLRQSFARVMVQARREAVWLLHTGGHKQGLRWLKKMRTWLGRLIRDIRRKIAGDPELEAAFETALARAEQVLTQAPKDKGKLYALHTPEVECIGKGKARTRYEFGVKASIATTNERTKGGQFVLGAKALPGSPYDGHTLAAQIDQVARLTGRKVRRAYADRGYRGHGVERDGLDITLSHTRGIASPTIRREMRRRNGIEPVIGHMKDDGLLERNHLAGTEGDAINVILCAAGHNMRLLARWFKELLALIQVAILWFSPRSLEHQRSASTA